MIDLVKQTMLAKHKHLLTLKIAGHAVQLSLLRCAQALDIWHQLQQKKEKRKHYTLGASLFRSQVLHWVAQASFRDDFTMRSGKDRVDNDADKLQLNVRQSAPDTK